MKNCITIFLKNYNRPKGRQKLSLIEHITRRVLRVSLFSPLKFVYRYFRDKDKGEHIASCSYQGFVFYYPTRSIIGQFIADGKGRDINLVTILKTLFPNDASPVIAEIGTNIGGSLMQMELAKPKAFFYCFEPSKRFLPILLKNIEENNWSNTRVEATQ